MNDYKVKATNSKGQSIYLSSYERLKDAVTILAIDATYHDDCSYVVTDSMGNVVLTVSKVDGLIGPINIDLQALYQYGHEFFKDGMLSF